jgi:hypothetical protein
MLPDSQASMYLMMMMMMMMMQPRVGVRQCSQVSTSTMTHAALSEATMIQAFEPRITTSIAACHPLLAAAAHKALPDTKHQSWHCNPLTERSP